MTMTGGCRSRSWEARWPSGCARRAARAWRSWRTAWGDWSPARRWHLRVPATSSAWCCWGRPTAAHSRPCRPCAAPTRWCARWRGLPARHRLAPPDERFVSIVGVGQETVTAVTRRNDDFVYTLTRQGDGTVPATSAALAGVRSAYARVAHSNLTRDPVVAAAVVDMLRRGSTTRLPAAWLSSSRACTQVSDRQLRRSHAQKVDWAALTPG